MDRRPDITGAAGVDPGGVVEVSVPPPPGPYGPWSTPYPQPVPPAYPYPWPQAPAGYPGYGPPPPAPGPRTGRRVAVVAGVLVAAVVLAVGSFVGAMALLGGDAEVVREPVATAGENPFMPSVGSDTTVAPVAQVQGSYRGDTPGLYGGTGDDATCDRSQLRRFLADHPDRGAGWAGVLGVTTGDIARYVDSLTPVLLRADTFVTNHGWRDGAVTSYPAVLQAGTAVLVDPYGNPVTRCFCGNPLTAPSSFSSVAYVGPSWTSFSTTSITVISSSTTVVNDYTIVDVRTGRGNDRPRGSDGDDDRPARVVDSPFDGPDAPGGDSTTDTSRIDTEDAQAGGDAATTGDTATTGTGADATTSPSAPTGADPLPGTTWRGSASCASGHDGLAGQLVELGTDGRFSIAGTPSGRYTVSGGTLELVAEDSLAGDPPSEFTGSGDTLTAADGCTLTRQ